MFIRVVLGNITGFFKKTNLLFAFSRELPGTPSQRMRQDTK